MEPKNHLLEKGNHLSKHDFQVPLIFQGVVIAFLRCPDSRSPTFSWRTRFQSREFLCWKFLTSWENLETRSETQMIWGCQIGSPGSRCHHVKIVFKKKPQLWEKKMTSSFWMINPYFFQELWSKWLKLVFSNQAFQKGGHLGFFRRSKIPRWHRAKCQQQQTWWVLIGMPWKLRKEMREVWGG